MASNLRVDTILPSSGTTLGIGTAGGTINFLGNSNLTTSGDVTIGGNLGVGGTITYEDVARVDATGISTFREGYQVGPLTGIALTAYKDGSIRTTGIITASSFGSDTNSIFTTGGTERFRINSSGNVSIGNNPTVHSDTLLHVEKSGETNVVFEGDTSTLGARLTLKNNNTGAGALNQIDFADAGGQSTSSIKGFNTDQTNNYGELAFFTRSAQGSPPTERVRITSAGDVNITGVTTATAFVPTEGQLSHRNLIINGAMQVAQRGTSVTDDGYKTVDRFILAYGGSDNHLTQAHHALTSSDTGPWAKGFRHSFHATNGNQTSGAGASDYTQLNYKIEAQDLANSGWDYTSASSYITISFWIKASVAQTYYCNLETPDGTVQLYTFSTGALSANTWTKVTKTIPGNSSITVNNDNGIGMILIINAFLGTTYTTSSHTLNQWAAAGSYGNMAPDMTSTWWTTDDATFEITGVQLEVGSVATPFEHRSYGEELSRCQRYYTKQSGPSQGDWAIGTCSCLTSSNTGITVRLPTSMRATPSIVSNITGGVRYRLNSSGANTNSGNDPSINTGMSTTDQVYLEVAGFSGLAAGQSGTLRRYLGSGTLAFNSEL